MRTSYAALQSRPSLRTRMLVALPLAASVYCMGLVRDAHAQPTQYIEQSTPYSQAQPAFSQQELDRMLAPIALYPDSLLSQILMAATYPLEVVQAARWSRAHPGLGGDDAVRSVANQDWDPSVQSLVAFPQVLSMMDERLDWTQRLGDAFLDQEPHVMQTVQMLRERAYAAGNLNSTGQLRVVRQDRFILVEPVNPQLVYVPYYDPTFIYGSWWWPAPPVYWRPWAGYAPVHARPGVSASFFWGSGVRVSAGFFFGRPDWQRRSVNVVQVNNYYNRPVVVNRGGPPARDYAGPARWTHDPSHRGSIPYRDAAVRQQFGAQQQQAVQQHEQRREQTQDRRGPASVQTQPAQGATPQRQEARPADASPAQRAQEQRDERRRDRRDEGRSDRRDDGRGEGRGDPRQDRGTGARSDAAPSAPAVSAAVQRTDQAQEQRQQAERQQQAQRQQQEQAQRQQAERQQQAQRQEQAQRQQAERQQQAQRQQQEQAQRQQAERQQQAQRQQAERQQQAQRQQQEQAQRQQAERQQQAQRQQQEQAQRQQQQTQQSQQRQEQRQARQEDRPQQQREGRGEGRGEGKGEGKGEKRG